MDWSRLFDSPRPLPFFKGCQVVKITKKALKRPKTGPKMSNVGLLQVWTGKRTDKQTYPYVPYQIFLHCNKLRSSDYTMSWSGQPLDLQIQFRKSEILRKL